MPFSVLAEVFSKGRYYTKGIPLPYCNYYIRHFLFVSLSYSIVVTQTQVIMIILCGRGEQSIDADRMIKHGRRPPQSWWTERVSVVVLIISGIEEETIGGEYKRWASARVHASRKQLNRRTPKQTGHRANQICRMTPQKTRVNYSNLRVQPVCWGPSLRNLKKPL